MHRVLPYVAFIAIVVGFGNFFWFFFEYQALGGSASEGYVADGRYFLGCCGPYIEVTKETWEWSQFHGTSLFVTHPLALLGMVYLVVRRAFPALGKSAESALANAQRLSQVEQSGRLLATERCTAIVGDVSLGFPLFNVSVYPGGLVIKPTLMTPRAVPAGEISRAYVQRTRLSGNPLVVEHAGTELRSPVKLYVSADGPVTKAALGLFGSAIPVIPAPAAQGQREEMPRMVGNGLVALGVAVMVALIIIGIVWAIPSLGAFGVLWTVAVVAIGAFNIWRWWKSRNRRTERG